MSINYQIKGANGSSIAAKASGLGTPDDPAVPIHDVFIQDQHSDIIDLHLCRHIDDVTILSDTEIDEYSVSISCSTTPVAGNMVCFKEGYSFYQGEILSVVDDTGGEYTITIDVPLDFAFTTGATCSLRSPNLNIDGSSTPVVFYVSPSGLVDPSYATQGQKWDITRIIFAITDATAMDDAKFGGVTALTNGIIVRKKNNYYKNIFNAKSNGDFALHAYDVTYVPDTLGPAGEYGLRVRRSFAGPEKNGVTIRLDAETDDEIQIIVRDNLTGLTGFQAVVQGHIVQ